jgi:D-serine deaminase-like pyridoxal phosphate-dependent protein
MLHCVNCIERPPLPDLDELTTPALLIDNARFERNVARMNSHLTRLGVPLRPHLKTVKNVELARRMMAGHPGGATVSTLAEADYFFAAGIGDLLYAVGIAPGKLDQAARRIADGMNLILILDHPDAARAVARASAEHATDFQVLLEIDADGHRAGFQPDDPGLIKAARTLREGGATPMGVMVHAGGSYGCRNRDCLVRMARQERDAAVAAAQALRSAGFEAPTVSVGSTPTAMFAEDLTGVTEARAGVYAFLDLVMAGLSVCEIDDIAISVLTEVIGHRTREGQVIVDAGWMSLSRDRGTADQAVDQGYGVVCDEAGRALSPDVIVQATNQEHGILVRRDGEPLDLGKYPIGRRLRVLPNHACATAGQFETFWMVDSQGRPMQQLERCRGW